MDQLLFEQNPNPMLIYETGTLGILRVNNAFVDKYKYTQQTIEDQKITIKDIRPEEDIPVLFEYVKNLKETGISKTGVFRHQSKEGDIFHVKISSQQIEYEGHTARVVVCHDVSEQVEAEHQTAKALEELRNHIQNSPLASVKWDHEFCLKEWSDQAQEIVGFSGEEVKGKHIFSADFFDSTEATKIKKQIEDLVNGVYDRNQFETKIKHKNGEQIFIKVHSSALRDKHGELRSVLTLIEDITARKKSEIKYQRLFENANDGILILKDNRFVDCNKQAVDLYKAPKKEIIGKTPDYFSPKTQPNGSCSATEAPLRINKALNEGSHIFEWQHQNKAGDLIDVEVSLNKIDFPDGEYVQAIVRDVSDKRKIQAKLRKSEELFRNLFLKSPAALAMVDRDDRIQVVNESFEKMFGYALDEIRGKDLDHLIVPGQEFDTAPKMKNRRCAENDFRTEGVRLAKDGSRRDVLIAGMPVFIDDQPVAGLGMYIDISERKRSERELKKSIKEKRVLLEEVHHRVKNNLAVISGLLQMQTMHVDDERLTKYIQNSQLRIQSMAIVHEMLYQSTTLSEIQFNTYVEKLADVISEVLEPRAKNISIIIHADEFVLNVNQAIPCALVISELITNAYEYAFEGREEGTIELNITETDKKVQIAVCDDGIGLPADFEEKRKKSLGINLMENLCLQLETEMNVESGDWGTRFYFTFEQTNTRGSSSSNRI